MRGDGPRESGHRGAVDGDEAAVGLMGGLPSVDGAGSDHDPNRGRDVEGQPIAIDAPGAALAEGAGSGLDDPASSPTVWFSPRRDATTRSLPCRRHAGPQRCEQDPIPDPMVIRSNRRSSMNTDKG